MINNSGSSEKGLGLEMSIWKLLDLGEESIQQRQLATYIIVFENS